MAGAIDLAAVKARSDAAARAAEAPPPAPGQFVVAVTEASFQAEVLDRSFQVPVLLALTSVRAPAGAELTESLQALASEANGALVLAEVDVDANMRVAQALQVQGIPAVFAVISGQLIPGFEGVLPADQVREFVNAVLKAAADAGLGTAAALAGEQPAAEGEAEPEVAEDPRFDAAEAALADGDYDLARQEFRAILDAEPTNAAAALALRQVDLLARVESVDPATLARAEVAPDEVPAQLAAADVAMVADRVEAALRRLLDLIARVVGADRDAVRERLVEYFELLGPEDSRVDPARREMTRALF
jgi:putative thioredoxin